MNGNLSEDREHQEGFVIHSLAVATWPAGHITAPTPNLWVAPVPFAGDTVLFIHAYSCTCATVNPGGISL